MIGPNLDRRNVARWTTLLLVFGVIAALMLSFNVRSAHAAVVIYVTAGVAEPSIFEPDGQCSLREAVDAASNNTANPDCSVEYGTGYTNNNVIYVPAGQYSLDSATGPLLLKRDMRLRGPQVNVAAADLITNTTRPISAATEAIIEYSSGVVTNTAIIAIQSARVELEGLTLRTNGSTNTNVYGVNIQSNYSDIEISNTIFTDLTYGIALRGVTNAVLPTDINGNAFVNLDEPGSLSGIGIYVAGLNGSNVNISNNLFSGLNNYAIRVPVLGSAPMLSDLNIEGNSFSAVASAVALTRNNNVTITDNLVTTVTGAAGFNAAFDVFNSNNVSITNNAVIDSTLPAVRTRGTANQNVVVNYNRFFITDTLGANNAIVLDAGSNLGSVDISDNWWGSNAGPGAGSNDNYSDPDGVVTTPVAWLAYQVLADLNPIAASTLSSSHLYADFFSTLDGVSIFNNLDGVRVLRSGDSLVASLPFVPAPIGFLAPSNAPVVEDTTTLVTFTSDGVNSGTQDVEFDFDFESVVYTLTVNDLAQVICDYNDSYFNDVGVHVTEGETIGDRCVIKLTSDPGPGNYVDVTIQTSDATLIGFYNSQSGNVQFSAPPNSSFDIRFGTVTQANVTPRVIAWDQGIAINFSALPHVGDGEGGEFYADLVTCEVANTVGTPGYSVGDCPGLATIPVTIYDPGVTLLVNNSDLDLTGNTTDVCTFPSFSRDYEVVLSGPPGLNADPNNPPIQPEIVTVNVQSAFPNRVDVVSGATSVFDRTNWNVPQPVTIARIYTPPNMGQPNTAIWNYTTSSLSDTSVTTSPYYDDGVDDNGDSLVDGVSTTLTIINPSCPLLDGDGGVITQELPAAPFASAPEAPSASEGTIGE